MFRADVDDFRAASLRLPPIIVMSLPFHVNRQLYKPADRCPASASLPDPSGGISGARTKRLVSWAEGRRCQSQGNRFIQTTSCSSESEAKLDVLGFIRNCREELP